MVANQNLIRSDYTNFLTYCREYKYDLQISYYSYTKIYKYFQSNPDILTSLLEKIEALNIDEVDDDLGGRHFLYKLKTLNFTNDLPAEIDINPNYISSYLRYLSANPKKSLYKLYSIILVNGKYKKIKRKKIAKKKKEDKASTPTTVVVPNFALKPDPNKSFQSRITIQQLKDLFHFMAHKYSYLEKKAEADFLDIFSAQPLDEIKPIRWLSQYRNGINARLLFELIKQLCKHEYLDAEHKNSFYEKLAKCFLDKDGQKLDPDNLRSNFSKWRKKTYTDQCLEKANYYNQNFVFLNYFREKELLDSQQ